MRGMNWKNEASQFWAEDIKVAGKGAGDNGFMSIMDLPDFNKQNLMYKLKKLKNRPNNLLMIIEFVFSPVIQSLIDELNSKFDSNVGRPTYPREML